MAIGNVELKQECFLKDLCREIARMKKDMETEEEGKKSEYRKKHSVKEKFCPNDLAEARAYSPPGVATPKGVNKLPHKHL